MLSVDHTAPVSRCRKLDLAVRSLIAGGVLLCGNPRPSLAELPVPADVLVAAGRGSVLPPEITGNTMTIRQVSDKATLDWKSFNIGPENTVRFEQPQSTSVALNNIHQADPSRIFGTLSANGQVYLVNQNGFLFGKGSQVNVNSLVASTLNISQDTLRRGLSQAFDPDASGVRHAALEAVDAAGQPVKVLYLKGSDGQPVLDQSGQKVKVQIRVESGAKIQTNAADGRIILAAPAINNQGSVEAADGQVILAAAQDKVYLQLADAWLKSGRGARSTTSARCLPNGAMPA